MLKLLFKDKGTNLPATSGWKGTFNKLPWVVRFIGALLGLWMIIKLIGWVIRLFSGKGKRAESEATPLARTTPGGNSNNNGAQTNPGASTAAAQPGGSPFSRAKKYAMMQTAGATAYHMQSSKDRALAEWQ